MSDADVDGAHIRCLLLTLVHRYMRPLLEDGRVYAAVPPLHRFAIRNPGAKKNEVVYTYSEDEYRGMLADLTAKGRSFDTPQRYKGLGEMDASQLRETTMDPATRTLRRITIGETESALEVFDLLMGNDVAPRKEFIVEGAASLDRARIDA
jgi:DNA gyrase subunit B